MPSWWVFPVAGAFVLSILLTDAVRVLAKKYGVLDVPDGGRKKHAKPTPLWGGVAIYVSLSAVTLSVLWLSDHFTSGEVTYGHFVGFFLGGLVLVVGGMLDDVRDLPPRVTIWFPVVASLLAVLSGIGVEKITNPFGGAIEIGNLVSDLLVFVWIMGMIYTTKLLDGLDGLATGIGAIGVLMIALLALTEAFFQPDVALLALIAFASFLGFLLWNLPPATIFLGESGSTLIGYTVGVLAVISGSKVATALLVVGIPALDVLFVMAGRWREGKPIFRRGDRRHLHHKLFDNGWGTRGVMIFYYGIALAFGLTTLIFSSWQKLIALLVLFIIMILFAYFFSSDSYGKHQKVLLD